MTDSRDPELESSSSGDTHHRPASWFEALKRYVQETDVRSLNLSDMKLNVQEVTTILEFLADSQVSELDLRQSKLRNKMDSLSKLLTQTKIQKLNLSVPVRNADYVKLIHLTIEDIMSLMKVLKDTQITELDISANRPSFSGHIRDFTSHLVESRLTVLNVARCRFLFTDEEALHFVGALRNTSLTHLNLERVFWSCSRRILPLLSELKHTSITHLGLSHNRFRGNSGDGSFGDSLRDSKLVELDLMFNMIDDDAMDDLSQALVGSKITSLNLGHNCFRGDNSFRLLLKETQITRLDFRGNYRLGQGFLNHKPRNDTDFLAGSSVEWLNLRGCLLQDGFGVPFMRSLRFSRLKHLDVSRSSMSSRSLGALVEVVKHTRITSFCFSYFRFTNEPVGSVDQSLLLIGELSEVSKLEQVQVSEFEGLRDQPLVIAAFVEKLANSRVTSVNMTNCGLGKIGVDVASPLLAKTRVTHLNLENNNIEDGVLSLAANLKFTSISCLNLARNGINDEGAKVLAECLKETRIVDIDLSHNKITCGGAAALAPSLHSNCNLKLSDNQIGDEGLSILAEHVKSALITDLDVTGNPGNVFVVETAIWNNRRQVHQLDRVKRGEDDQQILDFQVLATLET